MFQSLQNYYPGRMKHYTFPTMVVHGEIMRKLFQVRADFRGETDVSISEMFVPVNEEKPKPRNSTNTMTEYFETYERARSYASNWKRELNLKGLPEEVTNSQYLAEKNN
jgi:hypothetical protein